MAKKWVCPVCGYVYEGENPPEKCPQCKVPGSKFKEKEETEGLNFACEHELGVAKAIPEGEEDECRSQRREGEFRREKESKQTELSPRGMGEIRCDGQALKTISYWLMLFSQKEDVP